MHTLAIRQAERSKLGFELFLERRCRVRRWNSAFSGWLCGSAKSSDCCGSECFQGALVYTERFRDGDAEESLAPGKALCECPRGQRSHLTHLGVSPSLLFARTWSFRGKQEKACSFSAHSCDVVCLKPWLRGSQGSANKYNPGRFVASTLGSRQTNLRGIPRELSGIPWHLTGACTRGPPPPRHPQPPFPLPSLL